MDTTRHCFITPAPDCPLDRSKAPPLKARRSRARIEYDLLADAPYRFTHLTLSHRVHEDMARDAGKVALDFATFHAKGQPCLRASALTKRYGWAVHYDSEGRIALVARDSPAWQEFVADDALPKAAGMRSKRA